MQLSGTKVGQLREDSGQSLTELARRASVSLSHLSMIESGARGASPRVAMRLAQALGTSVADLRPEG